MLLLGAGSAMAGCRSNTCRERVARKQCDRGRVTACIRRANLTYRLDVWQQAWMWRVSWCESHRNPRARNASGSSGLFQFLPSTWRTTPYGRRSIFSARWNALAAAYMVRAGRSREWVCR